MKEKIKYIIIFIAGILISVVISVSAATVITAGEVSYTSNRNTTVQTGLDNSYTKANTTANNLTTHTKYEKITVTSSYNIAENNSFKYGKLVVLNFRITFTSGTISSVKEIASISSTYAPSSGMHFGYGYTNVAANSAGYCNLTTAGKINCIGASNNAQVMINMSYYKG